MDNIISQDNTFSYKYSAVENKEIQEIRKRYLPQSESKLEELKRLDMQVQNAGMVESLCIGIISSLVFGLGMCLAMQIIGTGIGMMVLGIVIGIIGMAGILVAYPVCRRKQRKAKENLSPRILELTEELYQE
ncbi:MAG: hypothetical protein J6C12_09580 [Lachnospiraceae bacterium]|nr:hypothetical protein [Lachnospiraceae bacterium]MBP3324788.1 hypothetical protein [Coprococcus sp.]